MLRGSDDQQPVRDCLNSGQCQDLKQQASGKNATQTERTAAIFRDAIAKCQESARANASKGGTEPAPPPAIRPDPVPDARKSSVGDERSSSGAGSAATPQASSVADKKMPPQPRKPSCGKVDDIIAQADKDYKDGNFQSALTFIREALSCPNGKSVMRYIRAGMYACHAGDAEAARQYRKKVPADRQQDIERECRAVGIDITTP